MRDIPIDVAHFMGLIVAMWMYGIVLCMFFASIRTLWNRRHQTYLVLVITISLMITSTANVVVSIGKVYAGFITYRDKPGVIDYLDGWSVYEVLSNFTLAAAISTADSLLIFRLYTIWSQNWWIAAFPFILASIECVCSIILCALWVIPAKFVYPSNTAFDEVVTILCSTCTVLINLICTPCIVLRLWWIGRRGQVNDARTCYTVIIVRLIESGSLYTATLIIWVVLQTSPKYPCIAQFTDYIFIMVVAISPMLIVIRLDARVLGPSEMRNIVFEGNSARNDNRATPQNDTGVASTVIAFRDM